MCCATFIVKYLLFAANLVFSLLGLAIIGLGVVAISRLNEFSVILPVATIPIVLIVLGAVVFFIGFLACCGAIRESRCMLIFYSIIVCVLLAASIYLTVVILGSLETLQATVDGWIRDAFDNTSLRPVFHVLEATFHCCGHVGAASYLTLGEPLPPTCCPAPAPSPGGACAEAAAHGGCGHLVGSWMETFSTAIGGVLIVIIIVQSVAVIFALFLSNSIANNKKQAKRV